MTALKLTKRAKIAGLASMALAATSLTVMFVSNSALASTCADGDAGDDRDAWRALGAAVTTVVADTHLHLPGDADGHADHGDAAADHACADADADVDAVRAGTSGGDRLPSSDGLTCRNPMTAGERAVG